MATGTYKKRRQAFEGEDGRAQAIKRMRDEASIRSKLSQVQSKTNRAAEPISHTPPEKQLAAARNLQNKRIPGHRLTLGQALSRRTTETSRARVAAKYGATSAPRTFKPIDRSGGNYGGGLNQVAKMRQKVTSQMRANPMSGFRRRRKLPTSPGTRRFL